MDKFAQVNMTDYELSPILKEFTAQTKNVMSNKDARLVSTTYNAQDDKILPLFNFIVANNDGD